MEMQIAFWSSSLDTLVSSDEDQMASLEYHNIAFATPLFGNLDLKKAILAHSDPRLKNMYHFVNCDDIVPAVAIIEDVYANLTTGVSIWGLTAEQSFLHRKEVYQERGVSANRQPFTMKNSKITSKTSSPCTKA